MLADGPKRICCCGTRVWTRVICWIQLIGALAGIFGFSVLCGFMTSGALDSYKSLHDGGANHSIEEKALLEVEKEQIKWAIIAGMFLLLFLVHFVMAVVLLKGTYNENPKLVQAWIIYAIIFLVLFVIGNVVMMYFVGSILKLIFELVITLLIQGFFIWVVNVHKKEIQATNNEDVFLFPVPVKP